MDTNANKMSSSSSSSGQEVRPINDLFASWDCVCLVTHLLNQI